MNGIRFRVLFSLVFIVLLITGTAHADYWAKTYDIGSYPRGISDIQQTIDGGFIVVGSKEDAINSDICVWKLNELGEISWEKTYESANIVTTEIGKYIRQTSDGGYIVAGDIFTDSWGNIWILKLDAVGNITWQKSYYTYTIDRVNDIQQTSDGGYIMAGRSLYGFIVIKLDTSGNITWQKNYTGEEAYSIKQTSDGGYIVAGILSAQIKVIKLDKSGNVIWHREYRRSNWAEAYVRSIQQTADGGYIVLGNTVNPGDLWVLKIDPSGNLTWQKAYVTTSTYTDLGYSIQQTTDGGYIVGGGYEIELGSKMWILKLDVSGSILWQKTYGSGVIHSIQQTQDGGYIAASMITILKLDSNGNISGCSSVTDTTVSEYNTTATSIIPTMSVTNASLTENITNALISTQNEVPTSLCSYNTPDITLSPSLKDFEDFNIGTSSNPQIFTISNNGTAKLVIGTITLTGPKVNAFIIQNDNCSGRTINSSWSCTLEVVFSPIDVGSISTNISIPSNDIETPIVNVGIKGRGIQSTNAGQWAETYGGTGIDSAHSIQQTTDGGYIVAGETNSFGSGNYDILVLKLNASGSVIWQKTYGGINSDFASSIQQTMDGGYIIAGYTSSFGAGSYDFWVLKLDASGNVAWQRTYGGTNIDYAQSIQQTGDGGYIVAGHTMSFGSGSWDMWILKLDVWGNISWEKTYGGTGSDYAQSIQQTDDGGYIVAGSTSSFGAGSLDFWILKLDKYGNISWHKTYGWPAYDKASSIQQTADGGYIVSGTTSSFGAGAFDLWVLKLNASGNITWQKTYGGTGEEGASSIQQTLDNGYIVAGYTDSFGSGNYDLWVLKLDVSGNLLWRKTYGGTSSDSASSIQQTQDGGYILTGYTASFGAGGSDFWVLRLDSSGGIIGCLAIGISSATVADTLVYVENTGTPGGKTSSNVASTSSPNASINITPTEVCAYVKYSLYISKVGTGSGTVTSSPLGINCGADCTEPYNSGTVVTLSATPATGSVFGGWSGNVDCSDGIVTMNGDRSCTATFNLAPKTLTITKTGTGTGTVTSSPAGINCGTDCTEPYANGTVVTLTATASANSVFAGWSGICTGTGTCTVTMDADKTATATFNIVQHTLTVTKSGTGSGTVNSSPVGIYCGVDCSESYNYGTVVTLTASPDTGSVSGGWSGDADCSDGIVTMGGDKNCTATFNIVQHTLTIIKAGTGSGTVTSSPVGINCGIDCSEPYNSGTLVTLTASPDTGSVFAGWGGSCNDIGPTCTVTMDAAKTAAAAFNLGQHTLTITKSGTGNGTVTSNPAGIACGNDCTEPYNYGTGITLTATADIGSVFAGWSGDPDCSDGAITIDADTICTAAFLSNVSVILVPDSTSVPRGGTLGYTVTVKNNTSTSQTFKYWTYVMLPNGSRYPVTGELYGPVNVTLNPSQSLSAHMTHNIPMSAPVGIYNYFGNVGTYPTLWDNDAFGFTVTATTTSRGSVSDSWKLMEDGLNPL